MSVKPFNGKTIPYGIVAAGKPEVIYFAFHPAKVTKKQVKGIPGMDLTIMATVNSPRTAREIRRVIGGSFGREKLISSEFQL